MPSLTSCPQFCVCVSVWPWLLSFSPENTHHEAACAGPCVSFWTPPDELPAGPVTSPASAPPAVTPAMMAAQTAVASFACMGPFLLSVVVGIEYAHLRDLLDGELVRRGGFPQRLRGVGVVDAERPLAVLAHVRVDPRDAERSVRLHDAEARRGEIHAVCERSLDDVPRHPVLLVDRCTTVSTIGGAVRGHMGKAAHLWDVPCPVLAVALLAGEGAVHGDLRRAERPRDRAGEGAGASVPRQLQLHGVADVALTRPRDHHGRRIGAVMGRRLAAAAGAEQE